MGTPDFAVPVLEALIDSAYEVVLVITQPDRPVGRKKVLTPPPVKIAAQKANIPVFQPEKLKDDTAELFKYEADIIITAAYGQLLPKEVLEFPPFGCINVHASLLPELRGGAPIHYALLQGKEETGITIMYMAEKLDAGDIITQESIAIEEDDHVGTLHDKLSIIGAKLLMETLPSIFNRTNKRIAQDESLATFAPNISREQEKINWHNSQLDVFNQIRGLHPWPVAYTLLDGKRFKIWQAKKSVNTFEGDPGEIVAIGTEEITVLCGDKKAVRLQEIQPFGKKRMHVTEFLRGNPDAVKIGQILG